MKKIIAFIMMLFTLVGCGKKDVKVKLDYVEMPEIIESSSYLYITYQLRSYHLKSTDAYDEKLTNKDSFLLFVYDENCYGCNLLAPALKPYVDEHELAIYTIELNKISSKHDLYKSGVNTTPFLVVVEDGKVAYKELVTLPNNKKEHVDWVNKWMEKNIEWSEN